MREGGRQHYKTVVISDVHMGYKRRGEFLVNRFLRSIICDTLVLNGDIFDGWQLRKSGRSKWQAEYTDFLQEVMRLMEGQIQVIYIVGNHDAFFDNVVPFQFAGISILRDHIIEGEKHRVFITHGDVFDNISSNMKWLAKLGDLGYRTLVFINQLYNKWLFWRDKPASTFSDNIRRKIKSSLASSDIDTMIADVAKAHKCDIIISGHTHQAEDKMIGDVRHINCGDWLDSMTAVVEDDSSNWTLLHYIKTEDPQ